MIKVEVTGNQNILFDLNTFFRMAYPLSYDNILKELNKNLDSEQSILFHQSEYIDKFLERFSSPKEVVDFMVKNKGMKKIKQITVGDFIYVKVDKRIYIFFEE